jgi:gluconolactonase
VNTVLAEGLSLPEAPLLLADGSWLVAEMDVRVGSVTRLYPDGGRAAVAKTGRPNGMALGRDGTVWVCETLTPALVALDVETGVFETALRKAGGRALLWPNDLCFGPDGSLYVTDSGILIGDFLVDGVPGADAQALPMDGFVFRYDRRSGETRLLDEGLLFANGIAFGPDGLLYVNETVTGNVYRYRIADGRVDGGRELFGNVRDADCDRPGLRGPDGMAFSADGRLWVAVFGQGDVTVLGPDGAVLERLKVGGASPTNVAFGPPGDTAIYVVEDEHGRLERIDVGAAGLSLHS